MYRIIYICLTISLFFSTSLTGQIKLDHVWTAYGQPYGGEHFVYNPDDPGYIYIGKRIAVLSSSGLAVSKIDTSGNLIWIREMNSIGGETIQKMELAPNGNILVLGQGINTAPDFFFLTSYTPEGDTAWIYKGTQNPKGEAATEFFQDEEGHIYILGATVYSDSVSSYTQMLWVKLNAQGEVLKKKTYCKNKHCFCMLANFVDNEFFAYTPGIANFTNEPDSNRLILRIDTAGNLLSAIPYTGVTALNRKFHSDPSGDIYVTDRIAGPYHVQRINRFTGDTLWYYRFIPNFPGGDTKNAEITNLVTKKRFVYVTGQYDGEFQDEFYYRLTKLDRFTGQEVYNYTFRDTSLGLVNFLFNLEFLSDSLLILTGSSYLFGSDNFQNQLILIAKEEDKQLTPIDTIVIDSFYEEGLGSTLLIDNSLYIAGGYKNEPATLGQSFTVKYNIEKLTTSAEVINEKRINLSLFPNPATDEVRLDIPAPATRLEVVDLLGRPHFSQELSGEATSAYRLGVADWPAGWYVVQVWKGDERLGQEKLLVTK